jgi:CRISPR-associated exonuclease Cas4
LGALGALGPLGPWGWTVAVLAVVSAGLWVAARALAAGSGLSSGATVVSSDVTVADHRAPGPMLVDAVSGLRGRPDYLVREPAGLVPIEVKPLRSARFLYESDRVQVGAYLLLVRASDPGAFAGHGRVRYREAEFTVPLTPELEGRCLALASLVRAARGADGVDRTHENAGKCRGCAVRAGCGQSLAE